MTYTCTSCHDDTCPKMGRDERSCEHHTGIEDDPQPVAGAASSPTVDCPFHDQCNEIVTRLRKLERALCDIGRAVDGELL